MQHCDMERIWRGQEPRLHRRPSLQGMCIFLRTFAVVLKQTRRCFSYHHTVYAGWAYRVGLLEA